MDEGLTEANPFRAIKQKSIYKQRNIQDVASRSLTELQWSFVIDTAEQMADEDARHERTLFVLATLFAMYLRVSDLVGRDNWRPTMGDIRRDTTGNWWFHVVGKGNKACLIGHCNVCSVKVGVRMKSTSFAQRLCTGFAIPLLRLTRHFVT